MLNWLEISSKEMFDKIIKNSNKNIIIFKHSPACNVSKLMKNKFEEEFNNDNNQTSTNIYIVDVISNKTTSNYIAEKTSIKHESPQLIVTNSLYNNIYNESHYGISKKSIETYL